jgi:hypothetical protein
MPEKLRYDNQVEKTKKVYRCGIYYKELSVLHLAGKLWGKLDVATLIVTGFSLRVTLARHGVGFVYLHGN